MSHYDTNPAGKAATNVGAGPRTGNQSLGDKPAQFTRDKESYRAAAAEITRRYGERGDLERGHIAKDDDSIKPNVKTKRGPTKGNG